MKEVDELSSEGVKINPNVAESVMRKLLHSKRIPEGVERPSFIDDDEKLEFIRNSFRALDSRLTRLEDGGEDVETRRAALAQLAVFMTCQDPSEVPLNRRKDLLKIAKHAAKAYWQDGYETTSNLAEKEKEPPASKNIGEALQTLYADGQFGSEEAMKVLVALLALFRKMKLPENVSREQSIVIEKFARKQLKIALEAYDEPGAVSGYEREKQAGSIGLLRMFAGATRSDNRGFTQKDFREVRGVYGARHPEISASDVMARFEDAMATVLDAVFRAKATK